MSTISTLPPEAVNDFRDLYMKNPTVIKSLCLFSGEIGKLARICHEIGVQT